MKTINVTRKMFCVLINEPSLTSFKHVKDYEFILTFNGKNSIKFIVE